VRTESARAPTPASGCRNPGCANAPVPKTGLSRGDIRTVEKIEGFRHQIEARAVLPTGKLFQNPEIRTRQ